LKENIMLAGNQYDIICRDGCLGPLLAAFFLAKSGKKVLLLPPLSSSEEQHPPFLLPLTAGFPHQLLARNGLLAEGVVDERRHWFDWSYDDHLFSCPAADVSERMSALAAFMGDDFSQFQDIFVDFRHLWNLIDEMMRDGLMVPAAGLKDHWRIFKVLAKHQELLQNRRITADSFYGGDSFSPWLEHFFADLVPLMSAFRYQNLPMLCFAYGMATLLQDAVLIDLVALQDRVRKSILEYGGETSPGDYQVIFDGKWYIGVGREGKVDIRSRAFIANADKKSLEAEISFLDRRRDFFHQFSTQKEGVRLKRLRVQLAGGRDAAVTGYRFYRENGCLLAVVARQSAGPEEQEMNIYYPVDFPVDDPKTFVDRLLAKLPDAGLAGKVVVDLQVKDLEKEWGGQPILPPVMGGGCLSVVSSYKRFYHVGWENLPGFGLGGLIYAVRKTADRIIVNEYL